ncbi:hypothetical protein [Syntrophomonas zehnderi]|uniref:hypothetical protein n=1 Tax=Syntrophomonas zehnderi TaxID=404335 RepID=UPI001A9A5C78|nr:hypothetical protein [Syntrophomonas zehnderi]
MPIRLLLPIHSIRLGQQSVKTITLSEVSFIGEDNLIYGIQSNITIDTKKGEDIPAGSITITAKTDHYKYHGINIVLPSEAQGAPSK